MRFLAFSPLDPVLERRKQAEIHVHGLKSIAVGPVGYVIDQCPERRRDRWPAKTAAQSFLRRHTARQQSDGSTFHIALDTCDLSGKPKTGLGF